MRYDYVPLPQRKPLKWPNGARLAVIVTTNLEFWEQTRDTDQPAYPGGPGVVINTMSGKYYELYLDKGAVGVGQKDQARFYVWPVADWPDATR